MTFYKYHLAKFILIAFIFFNSIQLFAQNPPRPSFELEETLYFKRVEGVYKINSSDNDKIKGQLISIKLNQDLNPMTGFTSEVVFKPNDKLKVSPKLTGGTMNDGQYYIFDVKDIRKIEIEIALRRRFDFYLHYFLGVPRAFFRFVELYSDEVQKDYSGREEIDVIIENEMKKIYQIEKNSIEFNKKLNTVLGGFCIFVLVLFSALGA